MAWRREADKRLSEAVTVLYTDACRLYASLAAMSLRGYYHILYHFTHVLPVFMSSEDTSIHSMYAIAHVLICSGIIDYFVSDSGPVSISGGTSFRGISWSLGAARFVFGIVRSLWDLTGTSAAVLPMCLSNCGAIRRFRVPISWLRGFARPCGGASFRRH